MRNRKQRLSIDLSSRAKLRVTGADRIRFLNGQTTNDVRRANADVTQESCVLNVKGHLDAHLFLFATTDAVWIDTDAELREKLPVRLERYVIADDVLIEDVTDDFALIHVFSDERPELPDAKFVLKAQRLTDGGWDVWSASNNAKNVRQALAKTHASMSSNEWETSCVESGRPRWGRELTPEIIPPEANLAAAAIDYEKGCYIGQEVISRMKMSGQMRQQLCGVVFGGVSVHSGMTLRASGKAVGQITSVVFSERMNGYIALALIKRGFNGAGTILTASAGSQEATVKVVPLPFIQS